MAAERESNQESLRVIESHVVNSTATYFGTQPDSISDYKPQNFTRSADVNGKSIVEIAEQAKDVEWGVRIAKKRVGTLVDSTGKTLAFESEEFSDDSTVYFDGELLDIMANSKKILELVNSDRLSQDHLVTLSGWLVTGKTQWVTTRMGEAKVFKPGDSIVHTSTEGVVIEEWKGKGTDSYQAYCGYRDAQLAERERRRQSRLAGQSLK